jgi:hypothetical protein
MVVLGVQLIPCTLTLGCTVCANVGSTHRGVLLRTLNDVSWVEGRHVLKLGLIHQHSVVLKERQDLTEEGDRWLSQSL